MLPHLTRRELLRHAAYRTGEIDCGLWHWWAVRPVYVRGEPTPAISRGLPE
jgi:hypothetical protein